MEFKFKCSDCGAANAITPEAQCWRCSRPLQYFPCAGCSAPCARTQRYCPDCKTRARFGPLPLTDVDRQVIAEERVVVAQDLRRIERELRR